MGQQKSSTKKQVQQKQQKKSKEPMRFLDQSPQLQQIKKFKYQELQQANYQQKQKMTYFVLKHQFCTKANQPLPPVQQVYELSNSSTVKQLKQTWWRQNIGQEKRGIWCYKPEQYVMVFQYQNENRKHKFLLNDQDTVQDIKRNVGQKQFDISKLPEIEVMYQWWYQHEQLFINQQQKSKQNIQRLPRPKRSKKGHLIIWIGPHTQQNLQTFKSITKSIQRQQNFQLIQLKSNQQFKLWLYQYGNMLTFPQKKGYFISSIDKKIQQERNYREMQDTLEILRTYSKTSLIVYYTNDKNKEKIDKETLFKNKSNKKKDQNIQIVSGINKLQKIFLQRFLADKKCY